METWSIGDQVIVSEGAGVITHISEPFLSDAWFGVKVGDVYLWKHPQDLTKAEPVIEDEEDGMVNLIRNYAPNLFTAYESGDIDDVFEAGCLLVEELLELMDDNAQLRRELSALRVQNSLNLLKLHKLQNKHVR